MAAKVTVAGLLMSGLQLQYTPIQLNSIPFSSTQNSHLLSASKFPDTATGTRAR